MERNFVRIEEEGKTLSAMRWDGKAPDHGNPAQSP